MKDKEYHTSEIVWSIIFGFFLAWIVVIVVGILIQMTMAAWSGIL